MPIKCNGGCIYCYEQIGKQTAGWYQEKPPAIKIVRNTFYKLRIPLLIGNQTDPCIKPNLPFLRQALDILRRDDFPLVIRTKIPKNLIQMPLYKNVVVKVSFSTLNEERRKKREPRTESVASKLHSIKLLSRLGVTCVASWSPFFFPEVLGELNEGISLLAEAGCKAIMFGSFFSKSKNVGEKIQPGFSALVIKKDDANYWYQERYTKKVFRAARRICKKNNVRFLHNECFLRAGQAGECCGSEFLHDYQLVNLNFKGWWLDHFDVKNFDQLKLIRTMKGNYAKHQRENVYQRLLHDIQEEGRRLLK